MLALFCVAINPLWPAGSLPKHPAQDLSAMSGLCGVGNVVLCLFDTHLVGSVKPRSFGFG
jgi:hypothetical protein